MELSDRDRTALAERASTLAERLSGAYVPDARPGSEARARERLARWTHVASRGDAARFGARLRRSRLAPRAVEALLGAVRLRSPQRLPPWLASLERLLRPSAPARAGVALRFLDAAEPIPFEEALAPLVVAASAQVRAPDAAAPGSLAGAAAAALERELLRSLSTIGARPMLAELTARAERGRSALGLLRALHAARPSRRLYLELVSDWRDGGLVALFGSYPVMARLMASVATDWVDSTRELLRRLREDAASLRAVFCAGRPLGRVEAAQPALSDPHRGRRTVCALTFSSGLRLAYKPRALGMDQAFYDLSRWLDERTAGPRLRTPRVLDRGAYGWVEWVDHAPCRDEHAARRFYRRAGRLLALAHVLHGQDLHHQNLVASGEHPVLIDLESLLQPGPGRPGESSAAGGAHAIARDVLADSVLRTGLLPGWHAVEAGEAADLSALGAAAAQRVDVRVPRWRAINTDQMTMGLEPGVMPASANVPRLDGRPLVPGRYAEEVGAGFRELGGFLVEHASELMASAPLAAMRRQPSRWMLRPSQLYATLLRRSLHPDLLRAGVDRSIELEVLARPLIAAGAEPPAWDRLEAEIASLERMDLPWFSVAGRLRAPDPTDLARQTRLIRASLVGRSARAHPHAGRTPEPCDVGAPDPPPAEVLEQHAIALADALREQAIRGPDGSAAWIGLQTVRGVPGVRLQPLDLTLAGGGGGLGLFLSALERVRGDAGFGGLARAAFVPATQVLADRTACLALLQQQGVGAADGLGSVIYALACASELLGDPSLCEPASRAASLITPGRLRGALGVAYGAAGAIPGLLALARASGRDEPLERAADCGRWLIQRLDSAAPREPSSAGLARGDAGIAYALLRLGAATGDPGFANAARALIDGGRPTAAPRDDRDCWCHGARGIALARLGGLPAVDSSSQRQEIEAALAASLAHDLAGRDTLRCGNLGRIDLLLEAGARLARPELVEAAATQTARVLQRASERGGYQLFDGLPAAGTCAGLLDGTAGIGYQLLRVAHPGRLPSVLLWA